MSNQFIHKSEIKNNKIYVWQPTETKQELKSIVN